MNATYINFNTSVTSGSFMCDDFLNLSLGGGSRAFAPAYGLVLDVVTGLPERNDTESIFIVWRKSRRGNIPRRFGCDFCAKTWLVGYATWVSSNALCGVCRCCEDLEMGNIPRRHVCFYTLFTNQNVNPVE